MASDDEKSLQDTFETHEDESEIENDQSETQSLSNSPKRAKKIKDGDKDKERKKEDKEEKRKRSGDGEAKRSKKKRSRSRSRSSDPRNPKQCRCLGVFGLSVYTTEDEIYHIFSKYGTVEKVQIVTDAKTRRSRGFCFVYYESKDDAKLAREECSGMKVNGRVIRVEYSVRERAHTPTPGIYMGKPTYNSYERGYDRRRGGEYYGGGGGRSRYRRSPSPYYRRGRHYRSRSRSY